MKLKTVALSIALLGYAVPVVAQVTPSEPAVSATGRGEVRVKPTRAVIFFTVTGRGATAAAAATENARLVASTIRGLTAVGVRSDDITNPGYNVAPDYDYTPNGRKQNGFVATNTIRVEIPKVADLGKIIDAGLAGGATQVGSAQLLGDKMEDARREALKIAVKAAQEDAEAMADAAGGRLGRLLSVSSADVGPNPNAMLRQAMVAGGNASAIPTSVTLSDLTISSMATARWEFVPRK